MKFLAILVLCLATGGLSAEPFGDAVVRCLTAKGVKGAGPEFDALMPVCEKEVDRVRKTNPQKPIGPSTVRSNNEEALTPNEKYESLKGLEKDVVNYLLCTGMLATCKDDRISDAATISEGLHANCKVNLQKGNISDVDDFYAKKLRGKVIEQILEYRAGRGWSKNCGLDKPPSKQ